MSITWPAYLADDEYGNPVYLDWNRNPVLFIAGPPGSGKRRTVGLLLAESIRAGTAVYIADPNRGGVGLDVATEHASGFTTSTEDICTMVEGIYDLVAARREAPLGTRYPALLLVVTDVHTLTEPAWDGEPQGDAEARGGCTELLTRLAAEGPDVGVNLLLTTTRLHSKQPHHDIAVLTLDGDEPGTGVLDTGLPHPTQVRIRL